jgi:hypothetical protein
MAAAAMVLAACYQQPIISPQRPLSCTSSSDKGECPKGFSCVADRVCAPNSCQDNDDCPAGLSCTSRGCVIASDGGARGDGAIQIPELPDGGGSNDAGAGNSDGGATAVDALALPDVPLLPDAGGKD